MHSQSTTYALPVAGYFAGPAPAGMIHRSAKEPDRGRHYQERETSLNDERRQGGSTSKEKGHTILHLSGTPSSREDTSSQQAPCPGTTRHRTGKTQRHYTRTAPHATSSAAALCKALFNTCSLTPRPLLVKDPNKVLGALACKQFAREETDPQHARTAQRATHSDLSCIAQANGTGSTKSTERQRSHGT